jgi:glycosyltransferase involved in cell wall biosynthesis
MTESSTKTGVPWVLVAGGFHNHGGMDKANAALAAYLLDRKTPLHLVTHRLDPQFTTNQNVTVHLVPRPAGSFFIGEWFLGRRGQAVARQVVGQHPGTRVLVNGGNCVWPDINWVHSVHEAWPCSDAGSPLLFKMKNRLIKLSARKRERACLQAAQLVLTNSEKTRGEVLSSFHVSPEKIHTIYLGTDPSWGVPTSAERNDARMSLKIAVDCPLVLFVGALSHDQNKGFDSLWSAWRSLCSRLDWDAELIVAGGGSGLGAWRLTVEKSGFRNRVRFLGSTDRIPELLAAADLLVSPVRYEAYGLNVQEAICRGVPSLASRDAGIAERYPDNLAPMLLADPNEVEDLIRKLLMWRANMAYWREQFEPLGAKLRNYSWADMASRIVSVVENDRTRCNEIVPESMIFDPQSWEHSTSVHSGHPIG